jgi:hypothetical protein
MRSSAVWLGLLATAQAFTISVKPQAALPCARVAQRAASPILQSFDTSAQQFDLLSLRSFRRDTILQYDATNQSEPLRIALTLLGVLFSISVPVLANELRIGDELTANVAAGMGTLISGALFLRNRSARTARMAKLDRETACGDLRIMRSSSALMPARTNYVRDLRGKSRMVALVGSHATVGGALAEARIYRRRLVAASAIVVPVYTDDDTVDGDSVAGVPAAESEGRWQWAAAPQQWREYFSELLSSRSLSLINEQGCWLGLNVRGRSFGSAQGKPRWDELLGTALQPAGDGFGELAEVSTDRAAAAAEAAAAAAAAGAVGSGAAELAAAEEDAATLLDAQQRFYEGLTNRDVAAMANVWSPDPDPSVSEVLASGGRLERWDAPNSNAFPPPGMRATDCDALIVSSTQAYTTAVERPREGGTLLATQRWVREGVGSEWSLASHRYIPWAADGATAVAALRCDGRGAVLLAREINTRAP